MQHAVRASPVALRHGLERRRKALDVVRLRTLDSVDGVVAEQQLVALHPGGQAANLHARTWACASGHVRLGMCVWVSASGRVRLCMCVCACASVHVHVRLCMCLCVCAYVCACASVHMRLCMCMCPRPRCTGHRPRISRPCRSQGRASRPRGRRREMSAGTWCGTPWGTCRTEGASCQAPRCPSGTPHRPRLCPPLWQSMRCTRQNRTSGTPMPSTRIGTRRKRWTASA